MLKSAMMSPELEDLTYVLEKCLKAKISEDDDDVRAAKNKLGFLKVKSGMNMFHVLMKILKRFIQIFHLSIKT